MAERKSEADALAMRAVASAPIDAHIAAGSSEAAESTARGTQEDGSHPPQDKRTRVQGWNAGRSSSDREGAAMAVLDAAGDEAAGDDAAAFSSAASSHGMASSSSGGAAVPAIDAMASSTAIGHRAQVSLGSASHMGASSSRSGSIGGGGADGTEAVAGTASAHQTSMALFVKPEGAASWVEVVAAADASVASLKQQALAKLQMSQPGHALSLHVAEADDAEKVLSVEEAALPEHKTLAQVKLADRACIVVRVAAAAAPIIPSLPSIIPPPQFAYPTDAAVTSAITCVAELVCSDIASSGNLVEQKEMAGPLLLRPFPIARIRGVAGGKPGLTTELLPYKGSHATYSNALASTNINEAQQRHVVAVVQASGSGKTRLAYADGQDTRLVVFSRVWKHTPQAYAPVWKRYMNLTAHWDTVMPHLKDPKDRRSVSRGALAAMRLLAACYVRFIAEVLQHVRASLLLVPPAVATDASAKVLREAALRCLRNNKGDDAVGALFLQQLATVMTVTSLAKAAAPQATVSVATIDRAAVDSFCAGADAQLRALLWPGAEVAMWWDQANKLMGSPAVFEQFSQFKESAIAPVANLQDGFYGLTALCGDLTDKYRWLQSLCGSRFEMATKVDMPNVSPLHGRVTNVYHASYITVDHMLETLRYYLEVSADTEAALRPQLALLVGRPIFFFDDFMTALWRKLLAAKPSSAAALQAALLDAAEDAAAEAYRRLADVIGWMRGNNSSCSLCAQLYAALRMNGGSVELQASAGSAAMRAGLLVLPLPVGRAASEGVGSSCVNLYSEPMCARVLENFGHNQVLNSCNNPSNDPIFALMEASMEDGSLTSFGMTTSIRGDVLELAFAWYLIRYAMVNTGIQGFCSPSEPGPTLSDALRDLSPPSFRMPERADSEYLVASTGCSCRVSEASPAGTTDLHRLCEDGAERRVLFDVEENAGADIATVTVRPDGTAASVVMVQANARKAAALAECLRAASPAWQYTQRQHRAAALAGESFEPLAARAAFQQAATAPAASAARFSSAFRIALSVTGFRQETVAVCNALNGLPDGSEQSPIILCQPSARAFGKRLNDQLRASCAGGKVTGGSTELAYLLPQAVDKVTRGEVERTGSAAVQAALRA